MGFLNFLAKFSFIGYGFNERKKGKQIAAKQYGHVMTEKEQMEKELENDIEPIGQGLVEEINKHKTAFAARPMIRSRDAFLDDRGLSPSQLRGKQLEILNVVATYDKMIDNEIETLQGGCLVRENWCKRLDCAVVIHKKKVSRTVIDSICNRLGDNVERKDITSAIANGGRMTETFVFNDAQIIVGVLAEHGISAKAVSINAQADVNRDSASRDPERDLPKIAKFQRFFLAGFVLLIAILSAFPNIGEDGHFYPNSLIALSIAAVVIFFLHWLLTKPIVALATKIVGRIFKKGGDATKDSATYLRGIFLSDLFDKGLDALDEGLLAYMSGMTDIYEGFRKWALVFMPPRVLDELLYEVINQMSTGASYNAAINNAEAKVDRQKAAKRQEERMQAMEQENRRHNIEMEKQARARAEYERQRAANAAAAAQAQRDLADAERDRAKAEKKTADELEKIRRGW